MGCTPNCGHVKRERDDKTLDARMVFQKTQAETQMYHIELRFHIYPNDIPIFLWRPQ